MIRCVLAAALAAACLPVCAQLQRLFPAQALRGELVVTQPPEVRLNGHPARLAPGARIRAANNMIVLSGSLVGEPLVVHYTMDGFGQMRDVWILTDAERARKPWPTTEREAGSWRFDPTMQTWSKP